MNDAERTRFHTLRQRELRGDTLTPDEAAELSTFLAALDAEESALLTPARAVRDAEIARLDAQIAAMQTLVMRRETLAARLRQTAQEADAERDAIDAAFRKLALPSEVGGRTLAGASR